MVERELEDMEKRGQDMARRMGEKPSLEKFYLNLGGVMDQEELEVQITQMDVIQQEAERGGEGAAGTRATFLRGGEATRGRARATQTLSNRKTAINHWRNFGGVVDLDEVLWLDLGEYKNHRHGWKKLCRRDGTNHTYPSMDRSTRADAGGGIYHGHVPQLPLEGGERGGRARARAAESHSRVHERGAGKWPYTGQGGHALMNRAHGLCSYTQMAHERVHRIDLSRLKALTAELRDGRGVELVDLRGVREKDQSAPGSLSMYLDWDKAGWEQHQGTADPEGRILMLRAIVRLGVAGLFRAESLVRSRRAFSPNWHLTWSDVQYFTRDHHRVEVDGRDKLRMTQKLEELRRGGGYLTIIPPPCKNDRLGALMRRQRVPLEFGLGGLASGDVILDLDLRCQHWGYEERKETPLFVDPETGRWMEKKAMVDILHLQIQAGFGLHGQRVDLEDIRRTWTMKMFRIGGEITWDTMGATQQEICKAGRWKEPPKGKAGANKHYNRPEMEKMLQLMAKANRTDITVFHGKGISSYPSEKRYREETAGKGEESQEGQWWPEGIEFPNQEIREQILDTSFDKAFLPEGADSSTHKEWFQGWITDLYEDEEGRFAVVTYYQNKEGTVVDDVEDLPIQELAPVWEEQHKERWCGRDVQENAKRRKK